MEDSSLEVVCTNHHILNKDGIAGNYGAERWSNHRKKLPALFIYQHRNGITKQEEEFPSNSAPTEHEQTNLLLLLLLLELLRFIFGD